MAVKRTEKQGSIDRLQCWKHSSVKKMLGPLAEARSLRMGVIKGKEKTDGGKLEVLFWPWKKKDCIRGFHFHRVRGTSRKQ